VDKKEFEQELKIQEIAKDMDDCVYYHIGCDCCPNRFDCIAYFHAKALFKLGYSREDKHNI
jgi:hypothetical protein